MAQADSVETVETTPENRWSQLEDLLAVISHDLRSPLSAISVAIDALGDPDLEPAVRDRYLAAMKRAVARAERFLTDLTDVGRVASGKLTIEPALISVQPLLVRAARDHEELARKAGNWIVVESEDQALRIRGDADRLLQALDKLITNALRHARGSGCITLRAEIRHVHGDDTVRLWVIDCGPGIPEREMEEIFERAWRGKSARRSGAGLGLPLAKGIAEAHGGSIHVESRPGDGASFYLELPAAA